MWISSNIPNVNLAWHYIWGISLFYVYLKNKTCYCMLARDQIKGSQTLNLCQEIIWKSDLDLNVRLRLAWSTTTCKPTSAKTMKSRWRILNMHAQSVPILTSCGSRKYPDPHQRENWKFQGGGWVRGPGNFRGEGGWTIKSLSRGSISFCFRPEFEHWFFTDLADHL